MAVECQSFLCLEFRALQAPGPAQNLLSALHLTQPVDLPPLSPHHFGPGPISGKLSTGWPLWSHPSS